MDNDLVIQIVSGVVREGTNEAYVGLGAKFGKDRPVKVWLPASILSDNKACCRQLLIAGLNPCVTRRLSSEIAKATDSIKKMPHRLVVSNGWHDDVFVFNGEVIGGGAKSRWILDQSLQEKRVELPQRNDELLDLIDELALKSDYVALATLVAFAGPVLGILQSGERPVISIWGESRTGKTTLAKLINTLTQPRYDGVPLSFEFTPRALEEILHAHSDSVVVFDEVGIRSDADLDKTLTNFTYKAANGRGASRSNGGALGDHFPNLTWKTISFMVGEKDIRSLRFYKPGTGIDARLLFVPVPPESSGGIWNSDLTREARVGLMKALEVAMKKYSSHSFRDWLRRVVRRKEEIQKRLPNTIANYTLQLAGPNADGLAQAAAQKFAQFAAVGDELKKAGVVDWPEHFPFKVCERLYRRDQGQKAGKDNSRQLLRHISRDILAAIGADQIPHINGKKIAEARLCPSVFTIDERKTKWVMIEKGHLAQFTDGAEDKALSEFRNVAGLLQRSGNSSYYQSRVGTTSRRFIRLDHKVLKEVAFPLDT
ncbi:DUF927 domain-containing protein [Rhizobium sp. PAMB 3182]